MSKLEDIMAQVRGLSYSKKDVLKNYTIGYVPVLRAGNIQERQIVEEDYVYVPRELIREKQYLKRGDILIAASSGSLSIVGKAAMIKENMEATFGAFCKVLRPITKKVDSHYFNHYFETQYYKRTIKNLAEGANINNLKTGDFDNLTIPLPPLPQQKKIAAILDAADAYRQKTKALIAKYDELTQSLFLDMFGDPRNNEKGFKRATIGEAIDIKGGSQPPKKVFTYEKSKNNVRLVQIRDYKSNKYITYVPKNSTKKFCTKDNIMIGRYGPPVFQILRGIEGAYNVALMKATPLKELNVEYVFNLLSCRYIQNIIIGNSQRTAGQTGVNLKLLNSIEISIPPLELQNLYEIRIKTIKNQKEKAQASLSKAEDLFNSLLQKAFKGELV